MFQTQLLFGTVAKTSIGDTALQAKLDEVRLLAT